MRRLRLLAPLVLGLTFATAAQAQFDSVYARTKAACVAVARRAPPPKDRPTPAQSRALKGCTSEPFYYGESRKVDDVAARLCAFREADDGQNDRADSPFSGAAILMQLYANGRGVAKDLDLALHYACEVDGAPAEIEGRVAHLQALKSKPEKAPFDYCDDITSGLAGGFCEARAADMAKASRAGKLAALAARVPPAAKPAFAALRKTSDAFIARHGEGEVDMTGTARAQLEIVEEEASRDRFVAHLQALLNGALPAASAAQAQAADAALNLMYAKALASLAGKDNYTTLKPADVRTAQRAWIAYRDAFVAFARAAAPRVSPQAVAALLTHERTEQLKDLVQ